MLLYLEFYRVGSDGARLGGDRITDAAASVDVAVTIADAIMAHVAFQWGFANLCLIKSQDGELLEQVRDVTDA